MAVLVAAYVRRSEVWPLTAAAVVVADTAAALIKAAVGRPRPFETFTEPEPLVSAGGLAFPSGHAATSFAAAAVLACAAPRLTPAFLALAAAIAWSRVYVGVHYPSDVVVGAMLGAAVGGALAFVAAAAGAGTPGEPRRRASAGGP